MNKKIQKHLKRMLDNSVDLENCYDPIHYELRKDGHKYFILASYYGKVKNGKEDRFFFHLELPDNIVIEYDENEMILRCWCQHDYFKLDRRSKKLTKELIKKVKPFICDSYLSWF